MAGKLYFDHGLPSVFSNSKQLYAAVRDSKIGKRARELRAWLEAQDAFPLHRPVRKRFPRSPYGVKNIMSVWECDLVDVQLHSKYIDGIKYLLNVVDFFQNMYMSCL